MLTYDGAEIIRREVVQYRIFAVGKDGLFIAKNLEADKMAIFHTDDVAAKDKPMVIEGAEFELVITKVKQTDGRIERRSELVFSRAAPPKEES